MFVLKGPRSRGVYRDSTQLRKVDVYDIGNRNAHLYTAAGIFGTTIPAIFATYYCHSVDALLLQCYRLEHHTLHPLKLMPSYQL